MNYRTNEDRRCNTYPDTVMYNNVLNVEVTEDTSDEPVTLAEVKTHLLIDYTDKDAYLTALIKRARIQIEKELNLSLKPKTLIARLRNEKGNMALPYGPVTAITELKDVDGEVVDTDNHTIKNGVLETSFSTAVSVEYEAGFAEGACPEDYKQMILERCAYFDKNRGDEKKTNNNGVWLG